jgi:hypothetical protein
MQRATARVVHVNVCADALAVRLRLVAALFVAFTDATLFATLKLDIIDVAAAVAGLAAVRTAMHHCTIPAKSRVSSSP